MEFSRQEYWWRTCHFLVQGKLPDPGIKPASPALAGGFFTTVSSGKPCISVMKCYILVLPQFFKTLEFTKGAFWSWSFFVEKFLITDSISLLVIRGKRINGGEPTVKVTHIPVMAMLCPHHPQCGLMP